MKLNKKIVLILVGFILLATPIFVSAKTNNLNDFFYIAESCSGDSSILGNVNDEESVAWLLQKVLDYIRIIGPAFVVVLSGVEFAKVVIQSDDEAMKKAQSKLKTRLILVGCLFFIPTIVGVVLNMFGITSNATCDIN